jgi:hypothetical protein
MQSRLHWFSLAAIIVLFAVGSVHAGDLVLADGGQSAYAIVVADDASPSTKHGAEELQKYLEEMTGAKLPIVSDKQPAAEKEIILGDNARFKALNTGIDVASLGKEGYVIRTVGDRLVIVGGALRGNMYGVYGLLEDHFGCHWFTPDCSRIPKSAKLVVGAIDDRQIPALEYREPFMAECMDAEWCAHNRINSNGAGLVEKHGGKVSYGGGMFVHTFSMLVPPDQYFKEHPEYFSLVKGERKNGYAQLCCTNPDVVRICTEKVLDAMRKDPNGTVFSVSQNDCDEHCECDACQALAKEEGTQMAPVLYLVNKIAEATEKEFPDKVVDTLAYQWTRKAPKAMRPRPNVIVRLCSIECCFSHPLGTCDGDQNKAFRADMEDWAKVASRLWIWDYSTNFANYLLPFPNLRVLGANTRFYVDHHVTGIFEEDTPDTRDSEFAYLDAYVMAKCFWNPNYDTVRAECEFLDAYYGPAAGPMFAYLKQIHDHVEKNNLHMPIYFGPEHGTIDDNLLLEADQLWQQAEGAVVDNAMLQQRVKFARMTADFTILERARLQTQKKLPDNEKIMALAKARYASFADTMRKSPIGRLREGQPLDKETYLRDLAKDLQINLPQ